MSKILIMAGIVAGLIVLLTGCGAAARDEPGVRADDVKITPAVPEKAADAGNAAVRRIKLTFTGGEAIAELYDNPTSRDLAGMLPFTVQFKDFNGVEKIAYPPRSLETAGAARGLEPSPGDLALYVPWGNLSVFYRGFRASNDLILMGRFISGLSELAAMNGDFDVTVTAVGK